MVYAIVAVDDKRGLANDKGIPWDLSIDRKYFRNKVKNKNILMGYGTYLEIKTLFSTRLNLVATSKKVTKPGFKAVNDAVHFLKKAQQDIWVIGGANLFESVWNEIDIIYLTKVTGDFNCTKFLPKYIGSFELEFKGKMLKENGISFHFEIWSRKKQKTRR